MTRRNTSPYELFLRTARENRPRLTFAGEFADWQQPAKDAVLATLGTSPAAVDPNPELIAELEYDGIVEQRWLIDVEDGLSAYARVLRPAAATGPRPGILCWAGHDGDGKNTIMSPGEPGNAYGWHLAQSGFVTFAIDWMGRGDLDDNAKPNHRALAGSRDWCNLYFLHATMLGSTPLGMNLAHGRVLTDFVATLPYVDPHRLGVIGLSGGGTLALWSALADDRLRAVEIVCYSDLFADFGYRDLNYCGLQVTPGLFGLVDVPDLQGLLAPRPLLVDIGLNDDCFRIESATACHAKVRSIYAAAGAADALFLDLHPGGHGWRPGQSEQFFTDHLAR
ncbi:alpha/beta hydrolase family protein [Kribbella sp. GL6]|uniref:alpha/beta hydrolase family protein n=1 Tax=Kribbella sp. GL6 TaxID=3419765 RepID=UPI003D07C02C